MDKVEKRQKKNKVRKNILLTLFTTIFLWLCVASLVYFTDPAKPQNIYLFFILIFLALLFTLSTIFINTKRGLIYSLAVVGFIALRYFGVGNILNAFLITGLAITADLYTSRV
jgi:hypothetical protein